MCRTISALIALLLAASGAAQPAAAQPAAPSGEGTHYWLYAGPSLTTLGPGASAGVSVETDRHVFSVRATCTDPSFGQETWDVGFLYGRALPVGPFVFSASTGVAVVSGTRYGSLFGSGVGRDLETMIGFPLEGAIAWLPTRTIGVGLRGIANVNTGQPFGGLGVTLRLGRLR